MSTGIADESLNNLSCFNCESLLSQPPTFITPEGQDICGRCESQCTEFLIRNHQYDLLARLFNFSCKYEANGCDKKLNANLIKKHEKYCPYRQLKCYSNNCTWSGIPVELMIHYKECHLQHFIDENVVQELQEGNFCYIFVKNNFCFLINYEYSNLQLILEVISIICPIENISLDCNLLNFQTNKIIKCIPLYLEKKVIIKNLDIPKSFTIDTNVTNCLWNSKKCCQCSLLMTPPIFKCPSNHVTCADCFSTIYRECKPCKKYHVRFVRDRALESEATLTIYYCRWANCNLPFSIRHIKEHEMNCSKRLYRCIHCCLELWTGYYDQVAEHHSSCAAASISTLQTAPYVTFLCKNVLESKSIRFHLMAFKELFRVAVNFETWGIKISLITYSFVSAYGWFNYEVDLSHVLDQNCPANKTLRMSYVSGKIYYLEIPNEEVLCFEQYEFLKITIRIRLLNANERKLKVKRLYQIFE